MIQLVPSGRSLSGTVTQIIRRGEGKSLIGRRQLVVLYSLNNFSFSSIYSYIALRVRIVERLVGL